MLAFLQGPHGLSPLHLTFLFRQQSHARRSGIFAGGDSSEAVRAAGSDAASVGC